MKKTRIIALALIVAVMVMGAGYAVWTDQLTVNGTVNSGYMYVHWSNSDGYPRASMNHLNGNGFYPGGTPYAQANVVCNDKTATISLTHLYPGTHSRVDLKLVNDSTMPVILNNLKVSVPDGQSESAMALLNDLQFNVEFYHYTQGGTLVNSMPGGAGTSIWGFESFLNQWLKGEVLLPGDYIVFDETPEGCLSFYLPLSITNAQNTTCQMGITADFVQYNDPAAYYRHDANRNICPTVDNIIQMNQY